MASVKTVSVEDLTCPVCCEIFSFPVILSCSHSICKECLQQFWKTKKVRQCPVCRRRSSRGEPLCNLVLKNLCESFTAESPSGSEVICSLHNEHLKLFCLEDEQPVCIVCRDSEKHFNHRFRPINEVALSYKVRKILSVYYMCSIQCNYNNVSITTCKQNTLKSPRDLTHFHLHSRKSSKQH